jgi:xanthine dehydrogenase FAD-binding subunit
MVDPCFPSTLQEALQTLSERTCKVIAGGTDLMVQKRSPAGVLPAFYQPLLFLNHVKSLHQITADSNHLHIGALATYSEILEHPKTPPLLKAAIEQIAGPAIRNVGTLAGNIVNASPAGDGVLALVALDATLTSESLKGKRDLFVKDFILGPRKTALNNNELVTQIHVPLREPTLARFYKVGGRKANAISKIAFAGFADVIQGKIAEFRLAFGAVGPVVVRSIDTELLILGQSLEQVVFDPEKIALLFEPLLRPIDDQRSTSAYRKDVALNLIQRFLRELAEVDYGA